MGYPEGWNQFKTRVDKHCEESREPRAECRRMFTHRRITEWWQTGDTYLPCVTLWGEIFFLAFLCKYCYSTLILHPQYHNLLPSLSKYKNSPCLIGKCTHGKGIREFEVGFFGPVSWWELQAIICEVYIKPSYISGWHFLPPRTLVCKNIYKPHIYLIGIIWRKSLVHRGRSCRIYPPCGDCCFQCNWMIFLPLARVSQNLFHAENHINVWRAEQTELPVACPGICENESSFAPLLMWRILRRNFSWESDAVTFQLILL